MHKFLTDEQLEEISKRVNAAQQGPWKSFVEGRDHSSGSSFIMLGDGQSGFEIAGATGADQDFIAAARQDIPTLLNEIKFLKTKLGK